MDLLPTFTKLYYEGKLGDVNLGYTNQVILVAMSLQCKNVEDLCKEVPDLDSRNVLALFQKTMIKFSKVCQKIYEVRIFFNFRNKSLKSMFNPQLKRLKLFLTIITKQTILLRNKQKKYSIPTLKKLKVK